MNSNSHTHALARFPNLANVKVIVNFTIIAYGKPIPSGIYVSPRFPDSVLETLEDPEFEELARIFDNRGLEAAYRAYKALPQEGFMKIAFF